MYRYIDDCHPVIIKVDGEVTAVMRGVAGGHIPLQISLKDTW